MANELRQYSAFQGGMLDAKIDTTAGGSFTFSSPAFANLPAVDSAHHTLLTIDPLGLNGAPEVAKVTSHGAAATTLTATGSQNTSLGRIHYKNEYWTATWEVDDAPGQGFGLIAATQYAPASTPTTYGVSNNTVTVVDGTNLTVSFTAPPSGKVLARLAAAASVNNTTNSYFWLLVTHGGTTIVAGSILMNVNSVTVGAIETVNAQIISGLTPGTTYHWDWAHVMGAVSGTTGSIYVNGITAPENIHTDSPATIEIHGVNV